MPRISKLVTVARHLNANTTNFDFAINSLTFVPDEVIVRNVTIAAPASGEVFAVRSNLVNNEVLFSIGVVNSIVTFAYNVGFPTHNGNGLWNFSFGDADVNGNLNAYPTVGAVTLFIQLEFIKN